MSRQLVHSCLWCRSLDYILFPATHAIRSQDWCNALFVQQITWKYMLKYIARHYTLTYKHKHFHIFKYTRWRVSYDTLFKSIPIFQKWLFISPRFRMHTVNVSFQSHRQTTFIIKRSIWQISSLVNILAVIVPDQLLHPQRYTPSITFVVNYKSIHTEILLPSYRFESIRHDFTFLPLKRVSCIRPISYFRGMILFFYQLLYVW